MFSFINVVIIASRFVICNLSFFSRIYFMLSVYYKPSVISSHVFLRQWWMCVTQKTTPKSSFFYICSSDTQSLRSLTNIKPSI